MTKYSYEFKLEVVRYYLSGAGGFKKTAYHFGIDCSLVRQWVAFYQHFGSNGLQAKLKQSHYTDEYKEQVVLSAKNEGLSSRQAALKFGPLQPSTVLKWLKLYDAGGREALQPKTSGSKPPMKIKSPCKTVKADNQKTQKELLHELVYLRAEVAYLKKYNALVQEKAIQQTKLESSQD